MPDENKLQALRDAEFVVKRTCYRCAFFIQGRGDWGNCDKISYEHKKHTPKAGRLLRLASVPRDGWCPQHETWLEAEALLDSYREFMEGNDG